LTDNPNTLIQEKLKNTPCLSLDQAAISFGYRCGASCIVDLHGSSCGLWLSYGNSGMSNTDISEKGGPSALLICFLCRDRRLSHRITPKTSAQKTTAPMQVPAVAPPERGLGPGGFGCGALELVLETRFVTVAEVVVGAAHVLEGPIPTRL